MLKSSFATASTMIYKKSWLICNLKNDDILIDTDLPFFKISKRNIKITTPSSATIIFTKTKDYVQPLNSIVIRYDSAICFNKIIISGNPTIQFY
jgi:hypothetical protein